VLISQSIVSAASAEAEALAGEEGERVWSESEVKALLLAKSPIPDGAVRFVRSLEFRANEDFDVDGLSKLVELRHLAISNTANGARVDVSTLKNLRTLELYKNGEVDLVCLNQIENLESLVVNGYFLAAAKVSLPHELSLRRLQVLRLGRLTLAALPELSRCVELSKLDLSQSSIANPSAIGTALSLQELVLNRSRINDFSFFSKLRLLRRIDLREVDVTALPSLHHMPNLSQVYMSRRFATYKTLSMVPERAEVRGDLNGIIRRRRV
jgi:hypothetical protein